MTITLTREEAQQVLDALESVWLMDRTKKQRQTIEIFRTRLAQPEPEPVAWYWSRGVEFTIAFEEMDGHAPLYLHPPQREWQGLTDFERAAIWTKQFNSGDSEPMQLVSRAITIAEAKLKEKNNGR
jgi:hypothetical protein